MIKVTSVSLDEISIHAPHARSDVPAPLINPVLPPISIHAPHARSDAPFITVFMYIDEFQSTLLMRGATISTLLGNTPFCISIHAPHARSDPAAEKTPQEQLISIHAPHARSDGRDAEAAHGMIISIHAPHARSDEHFLAKVVGDDFLFQSTLLMRGATCSWRSFATAAIFQSTLLMRGATRAGC